MSGFNQSVNVTAPGSSLYPRFASSTGATALITGGITGGMTHTTLMRNKFDITNATFATQNDLEAAIKSLIMADIAASGVSTGAIACGYVSTDYSQNVILSGGVYYISTNTISNNTNKYVAYTSYEDIVDSISDAIATLILNYGFTYSTIILQTSSDIVGTSMLGGDPQMLAIDLSSITGVLGTYGGSFMHDVYHGACIDDAGIVGHEVMWDLASSLTGQHDHILKFLAHIFETVNRIEFVESHDTLQLRNEIRKLRCCDEPSHALLTLPAQPAGGWTWNHTTTVTAPDMPDNL